MWKDVEEESHIENQGGGVVSVRGAAAAVSPATHVVTVLPNKADDVRHYAC